MLKLLALSLAASLGSSVNPFVEQSVADVPDYMRSPQSSLIANAGETTTTSLTETIYGEWISPTFQGFAAHYNNPTQFFALYEPDNGSATVSVPRWVSDMGTPADRGASVDGEYDATEATALVANELETDESSFSIAEYGIFRELTYTAAEDTISGDVLMHIIQDAARILATAANDDGTAKFTGLTNFSGTSNVALTLADLDDVLFDLAERGVQGQLVGVLDHIQVRHFFNALKATSTSMAVYSGASDRLMAANVQPDQGRNIDGKSFEYMGVEYYRSGLCDTANTGVDVIGCVFLRGDVPANRAMATFGQANKRPFTVETDVDIVKRTVKIVASMRWGGGATMNTSGQKVITKAT